MKVTLITFANEKHAKDRGFIKMVKKWWDQYYLDYREVNWQMLCDNAGKFKKKPEVINLILVRKRSKIQQEWTRHDLNLPEESHEGRNDINNNNTNNNGVIDKQADELTENNKELERNLQIQIEAMGHCFWLQLQLPQKLPKMKLTKEIESSTNKVLSR